MVGAEVGEADGGCGNKRAKAVVQLILSRAADQSAAKRDSVCSARPF